MDAKNESTWKIGCGCLLVSGLLVWITAELITSTNSLYNSIGMLLLILALPIFLVGSKLIQSSNSFTWRSALLGSESGLLIGMCFFVILPGMDHDWLSPAIFLSAGLYKAKRLFQLVRDHANET